MKPIKIKQRKISELNPAEYNPRQLTDKQYKQLKKSLKTFGCVEPVVINSNPMRKDIIVGGHQRCKVWADLGNDTIPTVEVELDEAAEMELNVRLNKNTGEFDIDALANFFDENELKEWGFEDHELGMCYDEDEDEDENYTRKIEAPVYEPSLEKPQEWELVDREKAFRLIEEIDKSKASEDQKEFLKIAAERHNVFNYSKVADYYSHADKDIQELMEKSGLVIIDFDKAIENGFVQLTEELNNLYRKDYA